MVATAMGIAMATDTAGVTDVALMSMLLLLLPMLIPLPTAPLTALSTALPQLHSTALNRPLPTRMLPLLTPMEMLDMVTPSLLMEDMATLLHPMEGMATRLLHPMEATAPLCMEDMEANGMLPSLPMEDI